MGAEFLSTVIELRTGKGTHSLAGILNIDAKRSIVNPRFNNIVFVAICGFNTPRTYWDNLPANSSIRRAE
jgi:hypothetical protein